jgi:hypothetical protein
VRLSNSKIKTFRRCENMYRYKYVEKLRPKLKAVQLERGSWIHDLLQHFYDGEDWKARHKELTKEFYNLFEEEREHLGDLPQECLRIMRAYLRRWKAEDKRWNVIDSEMNETITLPNGIEFNFIIDLVIEEDGGLWIVDHKTSKSFMDSDFMLIDAQLARYHYALEQLGGYTPLRGIIFNELRTKPPAIPEVLKSGGLSQRKNIDTDVATYLRAIRRHGLDPEDYRDLLLRLARTKENDFFRRTRLPKDRPLTRQLMRELGWTAQEIQRAELRNRFPRTPDKSCSWGCDYQDICIVELFGGDPTQLIKSNFEVVKKEAVLDLPQAR